MEETAGTAFENAYKVWLSALDNTFREVVQTGAALVPNLLGAALVLLLGWLLAFALRKLILRLGTGLDRLFDNLRERTEPSPTALRWPVSRIIAVTVYWLVVLFFLTVAANVLGLPGVAELFRALLGYLPTLLLTAVALFLVIALSGALAGLVVRGADAAGIANAAALGTTVRGAIIAAAGIIALGQIGVDVTLLVNVFTLIAATFFGGAALAFGLGASSAVRNIIAAHHARRAYQVGQRVRIGDREGEILELTAFAVVLDTAEGRTIVPARVFEDAASTLLEAEADDD